MSVILKKGKHQGEQKLKRNLLYKTNLTEKLNQQKKMLDPLSKENVKLGKIKEKA